MLNGVLGAAKNLLHGVLRQRVQPQLLDLLQLFRVGVRRVVLVVVVQAEQGEDLVDGFDMPLGRLRRALLGLSLPRTCR